MFTDEDTDKIAEIEQNQVARWAEELEGLIGRPVPIEVNWDSTYTLSPKLEPDFDTAGREMVEAFRQACQDQKTKQLLAEHVTEIKFLSVAPHLGFGCCTEGKAMQYRTTVYPRDDMPRLSHDEYVRSIKSAAGDLVEAIW